MKRNHIQARTHIPSPAPVILAVSDQIQQVLINLCINAIEAMPSGGEVTVDITDYDDHVEIRVQDTGPGIAESEHAHIFEPFISKKEYGTGLGLAVSYGIVQAHGGSLELVPNQERGACFRIVLPKGGAS
jgi:signal transduction histidine kinase